VSREQLDLEDFLRRGQAAQREVNRIIQRSDQVARTRPRARGTDPQTSHEAAKDARKELTRKQQAVLECLSMAPQPITDPEIGHRYNLHREKKNWPKQSDSGLRTRRHELSETKPPKVVADGKVKMGTRNFTLWRLASPEGGTET
jgi:hypothetical protein